MSNILEIDLILNRQKYPWVYNITFIISTVMLIFIYIIFTYHYQTYYLIQGRITNNKLELFIPVTDMKYIKNNQKLEIDKQTYFYKINSIDSELYVSDDFINYQYVYLDVYNLSNIDNYIYRIKIPKENKILAKYLQDYL